MNWKLNKEVSLGDLIAFVMAFAAVATAYVNLNQRVSAVEVVQSEKEMQSQETTQSITSRLDRIEDKLDRLIERK